MEFSSSRVAVVGGGIIGASIAWRLAQRGYAVSLFEKGAWGGESSGASAGMLAPGGETDEDGQFASMAVEGRRHWSAFIRELFTVAGLSIDYQENGAIDLAYSDQEWADLEKRAARQQGLGIEAHSMTPAKVAELWPFLRKESLVGGLFYPDDAVLNPNQVMSALRVACDREGVLIREHQGVNRISISSPGKVTIEAAGRAVETDAAVIAAGAWSGLLEVKGAPALPASEPVKGHLVGYHMADKWCQTIIRHGHTYMFQRSSGYFVTGATVEHVGFDRSIQPEAAKQVEQGSSFVLPMLEGTEPSHIWMGFRPASDGLQIGRWHKSPLYLAYGHYRNGILLAPLTAARVANEIAADLG